MNIINLKQQNGKINNGKQLQNYNLSVNCLFNYK